MESILYKSPKFHLIHVHVHVSIAQSMLTVHRILYYIYDFVDEYFHG